MEEFDAPARGPRLHATLPEYDAATIVELGNCEPVIQAVTIVRRRRNVPHSRQTGS